MKVKILFVTILFTVLSCKPNANKSNNESIETEINETEQSESFMQEHSSKNALDYDGTYIGTIPCADCDGIKTSISLFKDGTFLRTLEYIGKRDQPSTQEGEYTWNDRGSSITLETANDDVQMYQVGENVLFQLDLEGNRITSDLAEHYNLSKTSAHDVIENTKWVLTELNGHEIEFKENAEEAYIIFNSETSRLSGNNSCNIFNASYELKDMGRIFIKQVTSTLMACDNMKTEQAFNDVLKNVDNYFVVDGVLSLNKAKMAPLAKFESY